MMDNDRVTLTQRRSTSQPNVGAAKLQRSKLENIGEFEEEGGGGKVVVWVLIVIVLAAGAYFGIKNYLQTSTPDDSNITPTPTPVVTLEDKLVGASVLSDSFASSLPISADYTLKKQTVGKTSTDTYSIDSVEIQPYTSFVRTEFVVTSSGTNDFPKVTAEYSTSAKTITLTFEAISTDTSGLDAGDSVNVTASDAYSNLKHVVKATEDDKTEVYTVTLSSKTGYYLHTLTEGAKTKIVLDVLEVVNETTTITPTTTGTTIVPTPTEEVVSGTKLDNEFSTGTQKIVSATTGNTVTISKYNFADIGKTFTFRLFLTGGSKPYPNAEANLANKKLTVVISNLALDSVSGNGGAGSRNLNNDGVEEINSFTVANASNKSTYVFDMDSNYQYKMYIDEVNKQLIIEIVH